MTRVPSLRELFERLAGESQDPRAALEAAGYGDLEPRLVDEAIVNYAHGAPVEVAEHLSPFVVPHSGVLQGEEGSPGTPDTADGLAMLSSAPIGTAADADQLDPVHDAHHDGQGVDQLDAAHTSTLPLQHDPSGHGLEAPSDPHPGAERADLSFGAGERGAEQQVAASDAHYAPHEDQVDPSALPEARASEPGWLDVTSAEAQPGFGSHHDWTLERHGEPGLGHPGPDGDHHDPDAMLDGGAGT